MLAQLIYGSPRTFSVNGLALGYEDLNDHEQLCNDPLPALLAEKRRIEQPLTGKSTLNRLELTPSVSPLPERYHQIGYSLAAIDQLLLNISPGTHTRAPKQIVLDLDATDTPLHGKQEGRFFHGYYGHYRYLPLYIFCGDRLLCSRLRPSKQNASVGSITELERIVRQIRARWPKVRIILRVDLGFCREELMAWCESRRVEYIIAHIRTLPRIVRIRDAPRNVVEWTIHRAGLSATCRRSFSRR